MGQRHKDNDWTLPDGNKLTIEGASMCILLDLRDELKAIRRLIECPNVRAGFIAMQKVAKNTEKRKRPARK